MAKTLFIEILNDTELRLYDDMDMHHLADRDLDDVLAMYPKQAEIVLLDALHVQSKTFTRRVQDKKILSQVIAADMTDYLLHDSSAYRFAHHDGNAVTWVSWIEKTRLQALTTRFAAIAPRIKALVSAPLLMLAGQDRLDDADSFAVVYHAPLTYVLRDGQTTVMRSEQADAWLQSGSLSGQSATELREVQAQVFRAENVDVLPNLWQKADRAEGVRQLPYTAWAILAGVALLLWMANSYWDYRRAWRLNADALHAQQKVLQRVFPHAQGADPYGRLSAEYQRTVQSDSTVVLARLDRALRGHSLNVSRLSVDVASKTIVLAGTVSATLKQALQDNGFKVSAIANEPTAAGVQLSW